MDASETAAYWRDVGLGKGAWCCDTRCEISPADEARVFEEIPTETSARFASLPDVPTVPPRVDDAHVACWWDGCRYRVTCDVTKETVGMLKRRLCDGGLGKGDAMTTGARRMARGTEEVVLFYCMTRMEDDDAVVATYGVPTGCKILLAIHRRLVERAERGLGPAEDNDYWG